MQVGTTLPQVVFMGTGALGQGANGMAWALQLDLQFQVPVYMLHLGTPKASALGLSRLVQTPDGFTCQDYLGTCVPLLLCLLVVTQYQATTARWTAGGQSDNQTDSLNRLLLHTCPPLSQLPLPPFPPPPPESLSVVAVVVSIDRGVFVFCAFTYASANPHPRPRPRPRPHTYRPTLTPIQLVRRKPSFTDRTSEITLRYHRRGLVDRFFLDGPTVTFRIASQLQSVSSTATIPNSCRPLDPYPPASTQVPRSWRQDPSLNCPRRRRPPSQPPLPSW